MPLPPKEQSDVAPAGTKKLTLGRVRIHDYFVAEFDEHVSVAEATRAAVGDAFERLVDACAGSLQDGGKILFFGNGGSAADAQHLAAELTVKYERVRPALAAVALTTDTSTLTAIANDFGFEDVFRRQIEALGKPGDLAIGISTSGCSPNVVAGLKAATAQGLVAAALSGGTGGDLVGVADPLIVVPSDRTSRIQEMHIAIGQMLCGALETMSTGDGG